MFESVAEFAVITIPFSVLRHVEVTPGFSYAKQKAIRQLTHNASAKVFLQFRRRFCERTIGFVAGQPSPTWRSGMCSTPSMGTKPDAGSCL